MRKINIKDLEKYSGKILFEVSKELKMEAYFDNGPLTDNDYEIVTRIVHLVQNKNNIVTRIFINKRNPDINKSDISIENIEENNIQFFIPNKKELNKIKKDILQQKELFIKTIFQYNESMRILNKYEKLF